MMLISIGATIWKCRAGEERPPSTRTDVDETAESEEHSSEDEARDATHEGATLLAGLQALPFLYSLLRMCVFRKDA